MRSDGGLQSDHYANYTANITSYKEYVCCIWLNQIPSKLTPHCCGISSGVLFPLSRIAWILLNENQVDEREMIVKCKKLDLILVTKMFFYATIC